MNLFRQIRRKLWQARWHRLCAASGYPFACSRAQRIRLLAPLEAKARASVLAYARVLMKLQRR